MSTTLRRSRRPPQDPSAATRPQNALQKAALQSLQFRQKVQQANANSICGSTSAKVGRMPLRQLLTQDRFCVPIFQRRYCWTETQWKTLLDDATGHSSPSKMQHSLGRLTCTGTTTTTTTTTTTKDESSNNNSNVLVGVKGRSCILDGQQRFTTTTILLAAIRDLLEQLQGEGSGFIGTIESINQILFTNVTEMKEWSNCHSGKVKEGEELSFARLVPTFCDRWAYYMAILPDNNNNNTSLPQSLPRPLQAKQFFLDTLQQQGYHKSFPKLTSLLRGVLDGFTMLYFPVDTNTDRRDGTDDLMVIYERLALRDATFCKPTRKEEYQSMDGSDMIRNLLLGSFANENDALDYYQKYWLPLEQQIQNDGKKSMVQMMRAFLEAQKGEEPQEGVGNAGIIGGQIYAEFQAWFAARLAREDGQVVSVEEKVRQVGVELMQFSRSIG